MAQRHAQGGSGRATVVFTDESRFAMSFHDGRVRVWRRQGERYHDATVMERDRYGGGSIMVWGGMGMAYRTPLYRVQGNLNGVGYSDDSLQPLVLLALQAMAGPGAILQDYNARPHRARVVNSFLQQQQRHPHGPHVHWISIPSMSIKPENLVVETNFANENYSMFYNLLLNE